MRSLSRLNQMGSWEIWRLSRSKTRLLRVSTYLTSSSALQDLHLQRITVQELAFASPFKLTAIEDGVVRCFILYFDTWFIPDGSDIPPGAEVTVVDPNGTLVPTAEYLQIGAPKAGAPLNPTKSPSLQRRPSNKKKPTVVSFSTGPNSFPTHWKQTVFLLKSPFRVIEGSGFSMSDSLTLKRTTYRLHGIWNVSLP